jgi:putative ABC transport system ATP-binding protein/macrolide transport system ATP-binding/permease protein
VQVHELFDAEPVDVPAARCRQLAVDYRTPTGVVHALRDVDAVFATGRLTVVAGPSGSGKSSLLRVIAGLQRARSGAVEIEGVNVTHLRTAAMRRLRRRAIGVVLQSPAANLVEHLRAVEQVELAAKLRGVDSAGARPLLDALGVGHRTSSHPGELSGGEQQRVAFAAAAIGRPTLLLADEPTAQLDGVAGRDLVASMRTLVERGVTMIVASHDPDVIAAADERITLRDGRRAEVAA